MLTLCEATRREGYYVDHISGDVVRIVGSPPMDAANQDAEDDPPRFERLTDDATLPIEAAIRMARPVLGREPSGRVMNTQTADQSDGTRVTETVDVLASRIEAAGCVSCADCMQ